MKITFFSKIIGLFLLVSLASPVMGALNPDTVINNPRETRATELQTRLDEIKAMNKKDLTKVEKKDLRREVRDIKKELATMSGGVYLSVGAIILIALLLILLL